MSSRCPGPDDDGVRPSATGEAVVLRGGSGFEQGGRLITQRRLRRPDPST